MSRRSATGQLTLAILVSKAITSAAALGRVGIAGHLQRSLGEGPVGRQLRLEAVGQVVVAVGQPRPDWPI
jgi:uncharacterized protein YfeS